MMNDLVFEEELTDEEFLKKILQSNEKNEMIRKKKSSADDIASEALEAKIFLEKIESDASSFLSSEKKQDFVEKKKEADLSKEKDDDSIDNEENEDMKFLGIAFDDEFF